MTLKIKNGHYKRLNMHFKYGIRVRGYFDCLCKIEMLFQILCFLYHVTEETMLYEHLLN